MAFLESANDFLGLDRLRRGADESAPSGDAATRLLRGPVRLRTLTLLRWLAVAGQCAAIVVVHFVLGFPLQLGLCLAMIAASAWLNLFSYLRYSRLHYLTDNEAAAFIAFDIVQLCALLGVTGGLHNPFALLILSPVTIAASVLPVRPTALLSLLAITGVSIIGVVHLPLPWPVETPLVFPPTFTIGIWAALSLAVVFFAAYAHRVAAEAGEMKSALAATQLVLAREEQLAAIGGLAAAAAHELGTPLATIQVTAKEMARELKGEGLLEEDANLLVSQAERCRDILGRLSNNGVDTDDMLRRQAVGLMVEEAAEPFGLRLDAPAIVFEMTGEPATEEQPVLRRRPEIIYGLRNFIENASHYASSKVLVDVYWTKYSLQIRIVDDGPGFTPEVLARLGEPYLNAGGRARRPANPRNGDPTLQTAGLGLGFFIAKTLLERTGGTIHFGNIDPLASIAPHGRKVRFPPANWRSGAWVLVSWPRSAIEAGPFDASTGSSPANASDTGFVA
ncbi:MAG: ActS/PrrB/RegB family redox-sensitive histidine kinase [Pseudomonadota bacterium]